MIHLSAPIPFVFIHIPRTGGTSVEAALCRHFLGKALPDITEQEAETYRLPRPGAVHQHFALNDYERIYGSAVGDTLKFTIVRNPWEAVISGIRFFRERGHMLFQDATWKERIYVYLNQKSPIWGHTFGPQSDFLLSSCGDLVDVVFDFETLELAFNKICGLLKLPKVTLGRALATHSSGSFRDCYDEESREWVARHFEVDIALWGFQFEPECPRV